MAEQSGAGASDARLHTTAGRYRKGVKSAWTVGSSTESFADYVVGEIPRLLITTALLSARHLGSRQFSLILGSASPWFSPPVIATTALG